MCYINYIILNIYGQLLAVGDCSLQWENKCVALQWSE